MSADTVFQVSVKKGLRRSAQLLDSVPAARRLTGKLETVFAGAPGQPQDTQAGAHTLPDVPEVVEQPLT